MKYHEVYFHFEEEHICQIQKFHFYSFLKIFFPVYCIERFTAWDLILLHALVISISLHMCFSHQPPASLISMLGWTLPPPPLFSNAPQCPDQLFYLFNESMYQTVLSVEAKGQREHWYWRQQVDLAGKDRSEWPALYFPLAARCRRAERCRLSVWLLMLTPELVSAAALECHSAWPAWHLWHVIHFDWKLWQIETLHSF